MLAWESLIMRVRQVNKLYLGNNGKLARDACQFGYLWNHH